MKENGMGWDGRNRMVAIAMVASQPWLTCLSFNNDFLQALSEYHNNKNQFY